MPDQTADDFFGVKGSGSSPATANDANAFFGINPQPLSGQAHDAVWGSLFTQGGKFLHDLGYGVDNAWGAEPLGLDKDTEATLKRIGVFNDYKDGHYSLVKGFNEAVLRRAASGLDYLTRMGREVAAGTQAVGQGLQSVAKAIPPETSALSVLRTGLGGVGEIISSVPEGFGVEFAAAPHAQTVAKARSVGAIGEGERGFYDVEPATPQNVKARADAAAEAGEPPLPPRPPPVDVHELARRIDPETMQKYDALAAEKQMHREALAKMAQEREASPEVTQAKADVDTVLGKVHGIPDRLTNVARERLNEAQTRLDAALTRDTPEMAEARNKLLDADFAMRDLAPDVAKAYTQASDLMPEEQLPPTETQHFTPEAEAEQIPAEQAAAQAEGEAERAERPSSAQGEGERVQPPKVRQRYGAIRPVEGTGELRTRGLSEGVEAKAIEEGLAQSFGDLPEYRQVSMADQAALAGDLITKDYDTAKSIALGEKQPPRGILPESVFVAVEKFALANGDVDMLRQLATQSKLATEATTMGQRIRTLGERDPTSPVGAIQAVQQAREADLKRRNIDVNAETQRIVQDARQEVARVASTKSDWSSFVRSIQCEP